jgi:PBSX family phage portal protein
MADEEAKGGGEFNAFYVHPDGEDRSFIQKLAGSAGGDAIDSSGLDYEDEFKGFYGGTVPPGVAAGVQIIEPPVHPKTLAGLVQQNNTLQQCIDAMVQNVHGTGFNIELVEPVAGKDQTDDPTVKVTAGWFQEVWPLTSFLQLRKQMGEDKEATGNAYWEMLRNRAADLQMIRRLEPKIMRMVTLSQPTEQEVTIRRGTQTIKLRVMMRYRRFAQRLGTKVVFYKEYGCPLLINKKTGELLEDLPENRIKLFKDQAMGTEVLHFKAMDDVDTPYGVPKWYPQMPSVIGSRKAEEFNLDYFQAGGVPPLMIFVQGGQLGSKMKEALTSFLSSKPGAKQGAPVFEVQSTGGTLDSPGQGARVTVERFGREQQKDSMFESYDEKCEGRIRRAWRLPPIFVGKSDDYNLATAQASYAVAEAQVFKPGRDEFDELMNRTIMREIEPTGKTVMRSIGLPVKDVNQQLLAANAAFMAGGLAIDHYIETLNEVAGMAMKVREGAVDEHKAMMKNKVDMGNALLEVAKRPPPTQVGAPPGGTKAPKATGRGSASGPSSSSPKPKLTVVKDDTLPIGEELAGLFLDAVRKNAVASIADTLDSLKGLDAEQVLLFKSCLDNGPLAEAVGIAMSQFAKQEREAREKLAKEAAERNSVQ